MAAEYKWIEFNKTKSLDLMPDKHIDPKYRADELNNVYVVHSKKELSKIKGKLHFYGKLIKPYRTKLGYKEFVVNDVLGNKVHLQAHRITAILFIPNPKNLPHVNHKDLNRYNCVKSNLEWSTVSDNIKHSYRTSGRSAWNKGMKNGKRL